jgi:ATP-dependent Clp protease adaptor protein ClpS
MEARAPSSPSELTRLRGAPAWASADGPHRHRVSAILSQPVQSRPRLGVETLPEVLPETEQKIKEAFEKSWNVIVWNDPVNLMSYVVFVFMKVLGFTKEKATRHMLEVHHGGRSVVATETREKAEFYHHQIQSFGLNVTIEQNGE